MKPFPLYKALTDVQRLRILNLLHGGPLCVCHLMEVLDEDQAKVSKQLAYLKRLGLVEGERRAQWMVYGLCEAIRPLLEANLHCILRDSDAVPELLADAASRERIVERIRRSDECCPDQRILKKCRPLVGSKQLKQ